MATGPRYKVPFRRRRENRTDYYVRRKLLSGGEPRAVVRRSSKNISIQFVRFGMSGDAVITSATSKELRGFGWSRSCSNIPAAYLTGYLAGKKAVKSGIGYAVLDIGMQTPAKGAVLFAAVAGMVAAGLEVPHGDSVLPTEERLKGRHIGDDVASETDRTVNAIDVGKSALKAKEKKPAAKAPAKAKDKAAPVKKAKKEEAE